MEVSKANCHDFIVGLFQTPSIDAFIKQGQEFLAELDGKKNVTQALCWISKVHDFRGTLGQPACLTSDPLYFSPEGRAKRELLEDLIEVENEIRTLMSNISTLSLKILTETRPQTPEIQWVLAREVLYEKQGNYHDGPEYTEEEERTAYKKIFEAAKQGCQEAQFDYGLWALGQADISDESFRLSTLWLEDCVARGEKNNNPIYALDTLIRAHAPQVSVIPDHFRNPELLMKYFKWNVDLTGEKHVLDS